MKFNNNFSISKTANIGLNVKIGDGTIIYDNAVIGDNTIIANHCVIGEPLNDYYKNANYINPKTFIGNDSLIRSHTIIYAGSSFGEKFSTGHRVTIRENSILGEQCRVGTLSDIQGNVVFGDHCWLHSSVFIGGNSKIGSYVFIYPSVVFTNDPHPPSNICKGPTVDDFSQIAASSVILPNIKIGKHCLIGASSLVSKDVKDFSLVAGNPARFIKDIREVKSKEDGKSHYPWPENFDRSMPWENTGYQNWLKKQRKEK